MTDEELARECFNEPAYVVVPEDLALVRTGREYGEAKVLREVVEREGGCEYPINAGSVHSRPCGEDHCDFCWATARLAEIEGGANE
jgi:hypothetical protein